MLASTVCQRREYLRPSDAYIARLTQPGTQSSRCTSTFLTFAVLLASTGFPAESLMTKLLPDNGHVTLNVVGCAAPFHMPCLEI